jgi:GT2 family glycosyltransferase
VENAQGEFIVWVDGDMVLSNDFVARQVEFMRKHSDVGIAKGRYGNYGKVGQNSLVATLENLEFMVNTSVEGATNSRSLGTAGCIYRTEALIQSGGFNPEIRGVGEDMDAENRIRKAGWQLYITSAVFFETRRQTWQSLWKEYYWHGSGGRSLHNKRARARSLNLYKMLPPVALIWEILRVPPAYRLTRRKVVLLLPIHYLFKRAAWILGWIDG